MTDGRVALSFAQAHAQATARGMGHDEALGFALAAELAGREPHVSRDCLLAGMPGSSSLVRLGIGGLTCAGEPPPDLIGSEYEDEARATIETWQPRTTAVRFAAALDEEFTPEEREALREPSIGWGGGWGGHAILGYEDVLREGIAGIEARIREAEARAYDRKSDASTLDWYRAESHVCCGISTFIANHARRAEELAAQAVDEGDRRHFAAIGECCAHLARGGARNLRDAVQLLWFLHVLDETDSPGRIDQFLLPTYMAGGSDAESRRRAGRPILEALWERFIACRSWNVCLGGQTPDGHDATNELTFLFLDLQAQFRREAPNLTARIFGGSPPALLRRCAEVIALGTGLPSLYNDEVLVPALVDLGIPVEHARNYAMNGCMQIDIQGMSHMGLEDGELNLAKCLELALHEGRSPVTGRQVGPRTMPPDAMGCMDAVKVALRAQIEHCTGLLVRRANTFQRVIAETAPHLFRSLFIADCVNRGLDMKRGGPLYNHGQFLTEGVANTGDALYTIQRLVFEQRRLSLPALVEILDADWEGHEELRREVADKLPRFGNDFDEVDALTAEAVEWYFRYLNTQRTWRGGRYSGGLSTFNRAAEYGRHLGAGADGRRAGEPVADSCGPACGRDRNGPTAMLRSAAKLPHRLATSGFALNLRLAPSAFVDASGAGHERAAALLAGYFRLGGQQIQVNVVDAAVLRAAMADPSAHRDLIVRVGGFSARFVDLERALQEGIVARTEHAV